MNLTTNTIRRLGYFCIWLIVMQPLQLLMVTHANAAVHIVNKVPVVDIEKPNAAGVSHNYFSDFEVSRQGAVLNNATKDSQSQLAGFVKANGNLKGKAATLIINEVIGNKPSLLIGNTEVLGQRADVIIANPNGITCNGCGFINTRGITLTTGKPSFDKNGALNTLTVQKGKITIGEKGLNTSTQDYADIISRSLEINGKIQAQNLTVIQGTNKIDYATGMLTPITGVGEKPQVAIDTKALGGMYANRIRLVSNESGVGINARNLTSKLGDVTLSANGIVNLDTINANTDLNVDAKTVNIIKNSTIKSGDDLLINADKINNSGTVQSGKDMRLFANNITNTEATFKAKNNMWIQKEASGTRGNSLINHSAVIKTETGDLIIRFDNVTNKMLSLSVKTNTINPNSKDQNPLFSFYVGQFLKPGNPFMLKGYELSFFSDKFINDIFPHLKNASESVRRNAINEYAKNYRWLGVLDLAASNYLQVFSHKKEIASNYASSQISAGKSLYINANKLQNEYSQLYAAKDMYLTGGSLINYNYYFGNTNIFHKFTKSPNSKQDFSGSLKPTFNSAPDKDEITYLFDGKFIKFDITSELVSPIKAGGNLVIDLKNDIQLSTEQYDKIDFIAHGPTRKIGLFAGKDLVLNAANIKGDSLILAKGNISLLANDAIKLKDAHLYSDKDINVFAVNDIDLNQTVLVGQNLALMSRLGHVKAITDDKTHFLDEKNQQKLGRWLSVYKLDIEAGKDVILADQMMQVGKDISIISGKSINLTNTNSLLDKLNYPVYQIKTQTDLKNQTYEDRKRYFTDIIEKTNNVKIEGDATLKANQDIKIDGLTLNTGGETNLIAGVNINLIPRIIAAELRAKYFPAENEPKLSSVIKAGSNVLITAKQDIYFKAAAIESQKNVDIIVGRNFNLSSVPYFIKRPNSTKSNHVVTVIKGKERVTITAGGNIVANGSDFSAGNDMRLSSNGNMLFYSVVKSNQEQWSNNKSHNTIQQNVVLSSGGDLSLNSGGSITFQATELDANRSIDAAAKGGFLFAQAMQESTFYESITKKRKWYGSTKTTVNTSHSTTNKVVDFTANQNIHLMSRDDSKYQGSKFVAGNNVKLASTRGKVILEAVNNSQFEQTVSTSKGFFIKQQNRGYDSSKWLLPTVNAGGQFTVSAATGVTAAIRKERGQTLENAITVLGNTKGTQWLKGLNNRSDVQWNKVKNAHASWNYKSESLNPAVAAVIAVSVAAATSGSGLAAWAGSVTSSGTTQAMTQTVLYQAGYSGMSALTAKAAVSLAQNKGNISQTLKDLGRSDTVKSIATSMVVGGALAGFDSVIGVTPVSSNIQLPTLANGNWNLVAQKVVGHSIIASGVSSAINGSSFKNNFKQALLSNVGNQLHAESAKFIGDYGHVLGVPGKMVSHAVTSAIAAEIQGGSAKGAAAGALAAELAGIALDSTFVQDGISREGVLLVSKVSGAIAGGLVARTEKGVYSGATAAEIVAEYNNLTHSDLTWRDDALAQCGSNTACKVKVRQETARRWNAWDDAVKSCSTAAACYAVIERIEKTIATEGSAYNYYSDKLSSAQASGNKTEINKATLALAKYTETFDTLIVSLIHKIHLLKPTGQIKAKVDEMTTVKILAAGIGIGVGKGGSLNKGKGTSNGATQLPNGKWVDANGLPLPVPPSVGANGRVPTVLQSGGNTINQSTANGLNKYFGGNVHKREWGRALESLKEDYRLSPNHHGRILDNGDYIGTNGKVIGNIGDYLK